MIAARPTWRSLLDDATGALNAVDARWIVCEASGYDPAELGLVLDEPAQGVDITGQEELYTLIARARDERGCGADSGAGEWPARHSVLRS